METGVLFSVCVGLIKCKQYDKRGSLPNKWHLNFWLFTSISHFPQLLNAAYHVEVTFHSGSSVTRLVWEQIKQVSFSKCVFGYAWPRMINSDVHHLLCVLLSDHPQNNVCESSCHHSRVETQSGPGCHRKSQCSQTGSKHLLPVQNPAQQLPWGFCSIFASGWLHLPFPFLVLHCL